MMDRKRVFTPARLGPIELRNRVVKCATNEGMSRDGCVTDRLIAWHREFASGGVGMTTLAYCAVSLRGAHLPTTRSWIRDEARAGPAPLHRRRCTPRERRCPIQLGHAGWFASPQGDRERVRSVPSRSFSPHAQAFSRAMKD